MGEHKPSMHRSQLALTTFGHFLNDCYSAFLAPILPLLITKLSLSLTTASGLAAIPALASSVFQPLYGMASDRVQGRLFMLLGPAMTVICMSFIGWAPDVAALGILLLLAGIGTAAFHPQAVAAAGAASGERKGFGISLFGFGGSLGFALGPLVIIAAVHWWGLEFSGLLVIPGLLGVWFLVRYLRVPQQKIAGVQMPSLKTAFAGVYGTMGLLLSISVLREFTRLAVVTFLPIYLTMQGRSLMAGGITLTLFSLAGAVGGMVGGSLSDGWNRKGVISLSGLLCVPLLMGVFRTDGIVSLALLGLAAATLSGAHSVVIALAQELVPHRAGTASSLVMGLGWGVAGLLLIGFGSLAEVIGIPRALDVAAVVPLVTVVLALILPVIVRQDDSTASASGALSGSLAPFGGRGIGQGGFRNGGGLAAFVWLY
ncbi:MAG: MFS transporter [bacterium]|nr:MFS transporter [bacterium]